MGKRKTKKIKLTRGLHAIVDADFEVPLNAWGKPCKYHVNVSGDYFNARRNTNSDGVRKEEFLHHDVWRWAHGIEPPERGGKLVIDHIDGNTLNNAASNLRTANRALNRHNTAKVHGASQYKGVLVCVRKNRWVSRIQYRRNGKRLSKSKAFPLTDEGELAAAHWYDEKARELYGADAVTNFKS